MLDIALQQIWNAIMLGTVYSLVAIGFTLFFGVLNLINFAHGELVMVGAFGSLVAITTLTAIGVSGSVIIFTLPLILIFTAMVSVAVGLATERIAVKPLRNSPPLMTLLSTVGVSIFLREAVRVFYPRGASPHSFPRLLPHGGIQIGLLNIPYTDLFIIAVAILMFLVLNTFINKTRMGRSIRATAQNREGALMMGVDIDVMYIATFVIGSLLGAVGGTLFGMFYRIIRFDLGLMMGIKGFACSVVGGFGNVYGAILGSFLIGALEVFAAGYIPRGAEYKDVVAFVVVILFLVFRPSGILGEPVYEKV